MLPIVGPIRYEGLPVFLLYHCVNIAVLLTAVVLYLHPFDAARPSMLWIVLSHVVAFVSLAMVIGQVLLFSEREDGGIGPWGACSQVLSIFVLMAAGFVYWVFDPPSFRWLASLLAFLGTVGFAVCPVLTHGLFPSRRPWRQSRDSQNTGTSHAIS